VFSNYLEFQTTDEVLKPSDSEPTVYAEMSEAVSSLWILQLNFNTHVFALTTLGQL
jgi:hypothetical protein